MTKASIQRSGAMQRLWQWCRASSGVAFLPSVHLRLLLALWAIDLFLIAAHVIAGIVLSRIPPILNLAMDLSLAETFGYLLMALSSALLWDAYRSSRIALYLSFSVIFFVMLLDDSLQLHERLGGYFSSSAQLPRLWIFDLQGVGEMLAWLLLGLACLPWVLFGAIRTPRHQYPLGFGLALCTMLLAFFAAGVDSLHQPACRLMSEIPYCFQIIDLIEDGGEMLVQALILAHVVHLFGNRNERSTTQLLRSSKTN